MAYDREPLIAEICSRLAEGEPLAAICRDPHMPVRSMVYVWAEEDQELARRIAQARAVGFDAIADGCLEIADRASPSTDSGATDAGDVAHRKLQIETRLKLLAKWDPKRYGDRQAIEHSVNEDTAAILAAARRRVGG